jgi:hypothetical protein
MPEPPPPDADELLLEAVGRGNQWLRALLCTLARRGVALRLAQPERGRRLLDALAPLPLYKGGQFLFDLMEWEDLMVDGPPPALLPSALDARSLERLAGLLRQIQVHVDSGAGASPPATDVTTAASPMRDAGSTEELPELEPGFHLYQDVVLGAIASVVPLLAAAT